MIIEMGSRVVLREDIISFFEVLKVSGKQRILFINAYSYNLAVKFEYIGLDVYFDLLFFIYIFGYSKEDQRLWYAVVEVTGLKVERTLFIDDSEAIFDVVA